MRVEESGDNSMEENKNNSKEISQASIDLQKQLEYEFNRLRYDTQAKNLFGLKEVMGYMLKFMVPEFQTLSVQEAAK